MKAALMQLDRILRGETTHMDTLAGGSFAIPVAPLAGVVVCLAGLYGICMGSFAVVQTGGAGMMQMVASMVKVPALFGLTLMITFPSLYVFNALIGSRLQLADVLKLLIAAMGVTMAVLASLGPIEAFFSVSSTSYDFMILLNVLIFAVSGFLGLGFLLQTLHRLSIVHERPIAVAPPPLPRFDESGRPASRPHQPGPLEMTKGYVLGAHVKTVFRLWIIIFGLVGAQMGWLLRPFVGNPNLPFQWFRERDSNFFEAVWTCLGNMLT